MSKIKDFILQQIEKNSSDFDDSWPGRLDGPQEEKMEPWSWIRYDMNITTTELEVPCGRNI